MVTKISTRRRAPLRWRLRNAPHVWSGLWRVWLALAAARITGLPVIFSALHGEVRRADGTVVDYGLLGCKVVTTAGVTWIVDNLRGNLATFANMKYHGFGTGAGAEAAGDTILALELTTEYATDNVRPTGTQTTNGATVYETVATLDPDAAVGITEHGIFERAATGANGAGNRMLDRTLFAVINLAAAGDTLQVTYDLTVSAGG